MSRNFLVNYPYKHVTKSYSEACQTSKMESFEKAAIHFRKTLPLILLTGFKCVSIDPRLFPQNSFIIDV